ncbi:rRNA maturation RNase YbeY [Campylobacter hepaticus]|uniref:Endoribonuclease YbeY n=1 Tax=Campylobacter hepaticus TaxID=1813019 RepID=A0A424Z142_9BACT|nr:rRNA maturation RNase YbeY [Campylobacter hepaticus]AXP09142.1 rRNA maturation RNase YbeY [Campylobacter hepaticus]MCZ0771635.1 rRNA maturation RNase YbeY [Campylobacter hepaticus]MCZ0773103.1 rRNA maturation RNase YbeY [Campylobacter hepaticus]MCZ0775783.1 rRNA maturation RNase YbeY [Campylobacter hepaticus]MDX2323438.1 rRNA maturation RNase YbeY [Campylobacter hepaticus]
MILSDEKCDFLEDIACFLSPKDVELLFVDDKTMQEINLKQRKQDKTTDVLSFPLENIHENLPLGSIVINVDLAKQKAKDLGHTYEEELSLLFIHAMLHLLGFDHERDNGQMREKEKELIEYFKLPKSLIIRTLE